MTTRVRRSNAVLGVLTTVTVSLIVILVLSPALFTIMLSFSADRAITFPPTSWGLERYSQLFSTSEWLNPLLLSIQVSVMSAMVSVVIGTLLLLAVHRSRLPFRRVLEQASLIPLILPITVYAVALYMVFIQLDLLATFQGIVIANAVLALPYVVLVGSVMLRSMGPSLELVAFTLGAKKLRVYLSVTLRMALPSLVAGFVMAFQASFEEAVLINFIGGPGLSTLPKAISDSVRYGSDPVITVIAAIMILVTTVAVAIPMSMSRGRNQSK